MIPRLQGTEVKCPRCQESQLVPGAPIETSTDVVASGADLPSEVASSFHQLDPTSNYESSTQHIPAESVSFIVAAREAQSSGPRHKVMSPGQDNAAAAATVDPSCGTQAIPSETELSSTGDRNIFGSFKQSDAAHMESFLNETVPKSIWTLVQESGYQNTERHIHQLRKDGKVRAVAIEGRGVGYVIDQNWLRSVQCVPAFSDAPKGDLKSLSVEPQQLVEPMSPLHSPATRGRDIFDGAHSIGAARINKCLSSTVPKTVRTLLADIGSPNTPVRRSKAEDYLQQLQKDGKVRAVVTAAGDVAYISSSGRLEPVESDSPSIDRPGVAASHSIMDAPEQLDPNAVPQLPAASDRDRFGRIPEWDAGRTKIILSDAIPKTVQTLIEESGDPNTESHIAQLLKQGKVQAWAIDGGGVGYTLSSEWLKSLGSISSSIDSPAAAASSAVDPPEQIVPIPASQQSKGTSDRDIFGRIPGFGAAHMNTFLSATIPKTARTLMDLSGYQNTTNHLKQLRLEGKVIQVPLSCGQVGWIIDSEWLKSVRDNARPTDTKTATKSELTSPPARRIEAEAFPPNPDSASEVDLFGCLRSEPNARVNLVLSETVRKSLKMLIQESNNEDALRHIRQLLNEGKVRAVAMPTGGVGYLINSDWLNSVRTSVPSGSAREEIATPFESITSFSDLAKRDVETKVNTTYSEQQKEIGPVKSAQPTRKQTSLPLSKSSSREQSARIPQAKSENAEFAPASIGQSELTSNQKKVFEAVGRSYASTGTSPTIPELQLATSLNRFDTIKEVDALVRKGLFEFDRSSARGIRIIPEAERITYSDHLNSFMEFAQPRMAMPADAMVPVADLAPLLSSKTPERVADADVISGDQSPAMHAESVQVVPVWLDEFLTSELLDRQFQMAGRRVPPREKLKDFVLLLANQGYAIHRETLCHALELPVIRYAGFLSVVMRLLNVDNVPILTRDDDGEMVRLNVDLLCRQFRISKL